MVDIDKYSEYSLSDIYALEDEKTRLQLLKIRCEVISEMADNRIAKRIIMQNEGLSTEKLQSLIEYNLLNSTSSLYFPGDLCCFYPHITEYKASNLITCDFSGAIINIGSKYYCYRPLLDNLSKGKTFVLKRTLKAEIGCYDLFPKDLFEFEDFVEKLANPILDDSYNYYDLSKRLGEYLPLRELKKR